MHTGDSLLRFSAIPITLHKDPIKPTKKEKIPSSTVVHAYENEVHPPPTDEITRLTELITQRLIGKRIARQFVDSIHTRTVTSTWTDESSYYQLWHIRYDDDNNNKDLDLEQIRECIHLYKLYSHGHPFDGNHLPIKDHLIFF